MTDFTCSTCYLSVLWLLATIEYQAQDFLICKSKALPTCPLELVFNELKLLSVFLNTLYTLKSELSNEH